MEFYRTKPITKTLYSITYFLHKNILRPISYFSPNDPNPPNPSTILRSECRLGSTTISFLVRSFERWWWKRDNEVLFKPFLGGFLVKTGVRWSRVSSFIEEQLLIYQSFHSYFITSISKVLLVSWRNIFYLVILLGSLYKLFAKVLSKILGSVMDFLISKFTNHLFKRLKIFTDQIFSIRGRIIDHLLIIWTNSL
jgi:hypothetical protein